MAESDPTFDVATATPLETPSTPPQAPQGRGKKLRRYALMLLVPLLLIGGVTWYYQSHKHIVTTDNAYIQQDKISISSEISGRIIEVGVRENQRVNAGDLLFRVDPEPYRIAIAQADAAIAAAQVRVVGMETDLSTKGIDIAAAREDVGFFTQEYRRQSELMRSGFTTRARLEAAQHALSDARSRLADAEGEAVRARAALATAPSAPGVNPAVLAAQVQRRQAQWNLTKAEVRAPAAGLISQADRLQVGQMITQSLPALSIVANGSSWVEANFKETELAEMRVGQRAELTFDAYPDLHLTGHVASIGAGTGSEFSVLPAQNANGNWVKVTQRVPVRIAIDGRPDRPLIAGLSTHVRIDTSN